jgi:hypothetical protein
MPTFIDLTPTWGALVPAMLAAHANMTRQLAATRCDGYFEGWCSVHDAMYREDTSPEVGCRIATDARRLGTWRVSTTRVLADTEREFARMAEAADRWNASRQKVS